MSAAYVFRISLWFDQKKAGRFGLVRLGMPSTHTQLDEFKSGPHPDPK